MFLKQAYDCKLVLSLLGTHINITPKVQLDLKRSYERYFPEVDAFHAVSQSLAKEAALYGAPSERLHVIPTVISPLL
jgi:colanic acid/amylovoran biosynthesis glycosyltransferase